MIYLCRPPPFSDQFLGINSLDYRFHESYD